MLIELGSDLVVTTPQRSSYKKMLASDSPLNIKAENEFGRFDTISKAVSNSILTLGEVIESCYEVSLDQGGRTGYRYHG